MNAGTKALAACLIGLVLLGGGWYYVQKGRTMDSVDADIPVHIGDSQERVYDLLGSPNLEFPQGDTLVQWHTGCEVVLSNGTVIAVETTPVETEEERKAREQSIQEDERRLRTAYKSVVAQEEISYDAWLDREEKRLRTERLELAKVQAYEERRSEERKAAIRAEAIRRSRRRCRIW